MNSSKNNFSLLLVLMFIQFTGCSKSFNPNIERGSTYNFKEGYPEVRFSAIGLIDESGTPKINLAADIVYGSLIYTQKGDNYLANLSIDVQILDQSDSKEPIPSKNYQLEIKKDDPDIIYSQESFNFIKEIQVPPGNYKISLTVTDNNSRKQITNSTDTFIPSPKSKVRNLTNIRMLGIDLEDENPTWAPITTYDVAGRIDSLKFVFQVTNNNSKKPLVVDSQLIRFESDTTPATPMNNRNPSRSSIAYKGIDLDDSKTIQSTQRRLTQPGTVLIEFSFPQQARGNYRFKVSMDELGGKEFRARDFGIKSKNYPSVTSARELAQPLLYLMNKNEHEELMSIVDSDSLKKAVDRFWLKAVGNVNTTKEVIKKYYHRVEEANKQFSNFKEGWKTDLGMVYILFGPPVYVNEKLKEMQWSFSYNLEDPELNFFFFQPKLNNRYYPFEHYLLRRSNFYFQTQYRQKNLWTSGIILQRNI